MTRRERIKAFVFSLFLIFGFGGFLLWVSGCAPQHRTYSNFYCATPAGMQNFTSPQAQWEYPVSGIAFLVITNPGTGQQVKIPYVNCIEVSNPAE